MCQCRPADPTDPGDAADLSIMGYLRRGKANSGPFSGPFVPSALPTGTVAHRHWKINTFLTIGPNLHKQGKFPRRAARNPCSS